MENTQKQKIPETLKPEQMESGKWYVVESPSTNRVWLEKFKKFIDNKIFSLLSYDLTDNINCGTSDGIYYEKTDIIRHATKEEVLKYFPDEVFEHEPTDWEAMYQELKAKYDQLEPKGEKVYFYFDYLDNLIKTTDFEFALHESSEDSPIYTGVFMGKKKSVLVNE